MKAGLRRHADTHDPNKGSDPFLFDLGTGPRIVYGALLNDSTTVDAGSGDWSVIWDGFNMYTFTVTPPFSAVIANVFVQPDFNGDGNDPYLAITDTSSADASTFVVLTFDFIGDVHDTNFAFAAFEDPA